MENLTNLTNNLTILSPYENVMDCNDLTSNGLYMIFIGYIYPLLSPTMRDYLADLFISIKNIGKVTGKIVSLTEFGFQKVQKINNNDEMIGFIERLCKNKDMKILPQQIIECAWSFSGDTDNGTKENKEESWNKLLKEIDRLHTLNILSKENKP